MASFRFTVQDFLLVATAAMVIGAVDSFPKVAAAASESTQQHLRSPSAQTQQQAHRLTASMAQAAPVADDFNCYAMAPPEVVSSICMVDGDEIETIEDQWPAERSHSIAVRGQYDSYVDFTITSWMMDVDVGIAVGYTGIDSSSHALETLSSSCDTFGDSSHGNFADFQAQCVHGFTEATVTIVAHEHDDDAESENADAGVGVGVDIGNDRKAACNLGDLRERGGQFCAYRVRIPCQQIRVDCEELDVNSHSFQSKDSTSTTIS